MIRHRVRNLAGDESGAVLVLLVVVMAVVLVGTALVIDIAAVRTLRINQQSISDAAAAAAGADRGALVAYITAWATLGLQRVLVWDVPFTSWRASSAPVPGRSPGRSSCV